MSALVRIRQLSVFERKKYLAKMTFKYKDRITKRWEIINFPIKVQGEYMNVPLGYISTELQRFIIKPRQDNKIPDTITLRPEQQNLFDRVIACKSTSIGIEVKPGFGKTVVALAIASTFDNDIFIFVHRKILLKQWEDEINKFFGGSKNTVKVMMINMLEKTMIDGCVIIIDEVHLCLTKSIYPVLAVKYPALMIGLSATFYKNNPEQIFLDWFFPIIERVNEDNSQTKKLDVIVNTTNTKPDIINNVMGKVDWGHVLKSLASNPERNKIIVEQIAINCDKQILVLVKFTEHADLLAQLLKQSLPDKKCCVCYGNKKIEDDAEIYISTFNKMGTGISLNKLNCLVVAIDVKNYAIQYFGRVMREQNQDATIIDFVDDNKILISHYKERLAIYKNMGAFIKFN